MVAVSEKPITLDEISKEYDNYSKGLRWQLIENKVIKENDIKEDAFKGIEAIISSMTPEERSKPELINGSRRQRLAKGSGQGVQEVNKLLKQFEETRKMMRMMNDKNAMAKMMRNMPKGMTGGGKM
jgi:signal recognition particle subunit SRP54